GLLLDEPAPDSRLLVELPDLRLPRQPPVLNRQREHLPQDADLAVDRPVRRALGLPECLVLLDQRGVDRDGAVPTEERIEMREATADLLDVARLVDAVVGQGGGAEVLVAPPLRARDRPLAALLIVFRNGELLLGALELGLARREPPVSVAAVDAAGVHLDPVDRAAVPVLELWLVHVAHVL